MKIAVLSDIHSNAFALESVILDAKQHNVDMMVNLGDIFYGPIAPKATYDLLMENNFITIRGNQDRQIYNATTQEINSNPTMQFIINDLGSKPIEWMKTLSFDKKLTEDIYICHGSPTNDLEYLLENIDNGYPVLCKDHEIQERLNGQKSKIILCGHTHISRTVSLESGQIIINPGSVGLPAYTDDEPIIHSMENYSPHASYCIIEKKDNKWIIQNIKVDYDFQRAAAEAIKRNRKDWGHFLKTGRKQ